MQHSSPKKLHLCTVRCCDVHGRSVLSDLGGKKMSRSSTVYMWALKFGWVIGFAMLPPTILGDNCFHKEIQDMTHCVNPAVPWTTEAPEKNKHFSRYRTSPFSYQLRVQQCRSQQWLPTTLGSTPYAEQRSSGVIARTSRVKSPFETYLKPGSPWTYWWTSCENSFFRQADD